MRQLLPTDGDLSNSATDDGESLGAFNKRRQLAEEKFFSEIEREKLEKYREHLRESAPPALSLEERIARLEAHMFGEHHE